MKVFLSSTYEDLAQHRQLAAEALDRLGQQGVRMEIFGARPGDATRVCEAEIESADAFIGIYAHRYGFIPSGQGQSICELEFDYAVALKKPMFCFVVDEEQPWPPRHIDDDPGRSKLRELKARISSKYVIDTFTTPQDLAYKLSGAIGRFLLAARVKHELDRIHTAGAPSTEGGRYQVARRTARVKDLITRSRVLVVNDAPSEIAHLISVFEQLGMTVKLSTSSDDAMNLLLREPFDVVVSDMARDGVQDEGIHFLSKIRQQGLKQPVIFIVGAYDRGRGTPPYAFGITNRVDELLNLLFDAIERVRG